MSGALKAVRKLALAREEYTTRHIFFQQLADAGLPVPHYEYRFAPPRRWRADYAWPAHRVALEVEGGVWTGGRHTRGAGFLRDVEKYNELAARGWRLLRTTPSGLHDLETIALIRRTLAA